MKKTMRSLVTVLLVISMLLCVLTPAVLAAPSRTGTKSNAPALDKGWIEIDYDQDNISVLLRPDKEALSEISLSQIKEIFSVALNAAVEVVINDIQADYVNGEYGLNNGSDVTSIFHHAFERYVEDKTGYQSELDFFKAAIADDTNGEIEKMADYFCKLLTDAVKMDVFTVSELPAVAVVSADFVEEFDAEAASLGIPSGAIADKRTAYTAIIEAKYTELLGNIDENDDMTVEDLLAYLETIKIDTYEILALDASGNAMFNKYDLVEFIGSIPTFTEIAETATADMAWDWDITIGTAHGNSSFNLSIALGEGDTPEETELYGARVRKYAKLIGEHIDFGVDHDDTIRFGLVVPATFSKLLGKALKSSNVPEVLKNKAYALFGMSIADATADLDDFTFDELIAVLEGVNFEGLLDSEDIKNYIDLTDLTNEQIVNKVKEYERELNLVKKLMLDILAAVPEQFKDDCLLDYYYKNGAFAYDGSHNIDLEKLFTSITERYGALFASFFDDDDFAYVTLDLDLRFENMNRVRYTVDGAVVSEGLLPIGADVSYFGPKEADGREIGYWLDATTGAAILDMPNADTVLVPVYVLGDSDWNYTTPFIYDGTAKSVELKALPEGYDVEYVYTTLAGEVIACPSDAGTYIVKAIITKGGNPTDLVARDLEYTINKRTVDLSGAAWGNGNLTYNKSEQSVELNVGDALLGIDVDVITYTGNKATVVGDYTATVAVADTLNLNNYTVILPAVTTYAWSIAKADIDMSGLIYTTSHTTNYQHGVKQGVYIDETTLPDGVEYTTERFMLPGVYGNLSFNFTYTGADADCYNEIAPITGLTLVINAVWEDGYYYTDTAGNVLVSVYENDEQSLLKGAYQLKVANSSASHVGYTIKGENGEELYARILLAYDIDFTSDGVVVPLNEEFEVRIYLPKALRDKVEAEGEDALKLLYIGANNNIEELEFTIDGDEAVFYTDHFSTYAFAEITDPPAAPVVKDYTWLWILLIVVGTLAVAAVVVVIIIRRRKKKGDDEPTDPKGGEPAPESDGSDEVAEEAPVDEDTVEEAPAAEPVIEEAPVEETSAEEPTVEEAPAEEPVVEEPAKPAIRIRFAEEGETGERLGDIDGEAVLVRFRTSFESRYIQSGELQDYYTAIKNALLSYKGVKARTSWNFESFNKGRVQCAKLNIKGNALLVYLALDPASYNVNKYHFTDVSDKPKLDKVPMLMKVKSDRALKYVLELIEEMMKVLEIPAGKPVNEDYHMPYETTEQLASRGLVKIILPTGMQLEDNMSVVRVDVGAHIANETSDAAPAEEPAVEETPVEAAPAEEPAVEEAPVEEAPAEEPTVEEAPVEEAPAEEPAVEEAPVEEAPAEEPAVEEAPVEEAPAEEPAVEEAPVEEAPAEEPAVEEAPVIEEIVHVDAVHADEMLTNEQANAAIMLVHNGANKRKGKLAVVNLDEICDNFEEGETVDLAALKAKFLVPKSTARVKILARGVMTKALTVVASKYSLPAVKMIYLAGGTAKLED